MGRGEDWLMRKCLLHWHQLAWMINPRKGLASSVRAPSRTGQPPDQSLGLVFNQNSSLTFWGFCLNPKATVGIR